MNWTRIAIVVLSSGWFFLASCTGGLLVGTRIVSLVDARDAISGETMHSHFSVLAWSQEDDSPYRVMDLSEAVRGKEMAGTFLMPQSAGSFDTRDSNYSYTVIEERGAGQIIEVVEAYKDGDNTIWSRYEATRTTVTPISSRMFYFGYAFAAMPYAIGFAFFLYLVGRVLAYRNRDSAEHKNKRSSRGVLIFVAIYGVSLVGLYYVSTPTVTDGFTGSVARNFTVAGIVAGGDAIGQPYRVYTLERLNFVGLNLDGVSFLLPKSNITINVGDIHRAKILEDHGDWQLVQFDYSNTRTSTSIYRAYADRIEPVSYRLTSSVTHMSAVLLLFVIALVITGIITGVLNWRTRRAHKVQS
jgi:hypothetical protein